MPAQPARLQGVLKNELKQFLLKTAKIRRIHLIGCSRSGATTLHYAFIAFRNTFLFEKEASPWSDPCLQTCWRLWRDWRFSSEYRFFITKRQANWWQPHSISALAHYARRYQVFIINVIRDPRDVLTSRYSDDHQQYEVTPELWQNSMAATRQLQRALTGYPHVMTIKYEEAILHSYNIERQLHEAFGVHLRPELRAWSKLKQNLEEISSAGCMLPYLHRLRDFDKSSIAKWRQDPTKVEYIDFLLNKSEYRNRLKRFMAEHGYHHAESRLHDTIGYESVSAWVPRERLREGGINGPAT
jgi:hypothetical protein